MVEKRRYRRVVPTGLAPKKGKIFDQNLPVTDCRVVDLSAGGACLEVLDSSPIPKTFELVVGAVKKKCKLVWRGRRRVGVSF
jgi:hypothetical protein